MKTEINFEKYLNEEEIREIFKQEVSSVIRDKVNGRRLLRNIVDNATYHFLYSEIDSALEMNGGLKEHLKKGILDLTKQIRPEDVFRSKDFMTDEPSPAMAIVIAILKEEKDLVRDRVKELLKELSLEDLKWYLSDFIDDIVKGLREK